MHRALGGYNRGFAAQAVYNPRRKSSNFKRIAVNFNFITNGRTLGARTPLAFKNSPPFDKRTVPLSSKRGTAYGEIVGFSLTEKLQAIDNLYDNNNAAFKKRGEAAPAFFRKKGDHRFAVVEDSLPRKRFTICAEGTRIIKTILSI